MNSADGDLRYVSLKLRGTHVMVRDEAKWRSGDDLEQLKAALRSLDLKR